MSINSIVSLPDKGRYVRFILQARNAFATGVTRVSPGYGTCYNKNQFEQWCLKALQRRISLRGQNNKHGRKWDPDYQAQLLRDSRRVQDIQLKRVRICQFETREARERFSHLLATYED